MVINEFFDRVRSILTQVENTQSEQILVAAELVARSIMNEGIIYTFGTGHSHCIAEEVCWRAGCLVPIDAILEPSLTGHSQLIKSGVLERIEGFSKVILDHRDIGQHDVMIVISNSGRNAAPIEMAIESKERGLPVIAITSLEYAKGTRSRHSSGKKLHEVSDVVIDNGTPLGDAVMEFPGLAQPAGPVSNIAANTIIHAILVQGIKEMLDQGFKPPVFMSGNLDGADEYNKPFLEQYKHRVLLWY